MWEIFSLGATPYGEHQNSEIYNLLIGNERLLQVKQFPYEAYVVACLCWEFEPSSRPSFKGVVDMLSRSIRENHYDVKKDPLMEVRFSRVRHMISQP